jgi:hypothetical protein
VYLGRPPDAPHCLIPIPSLSLHYFVIEFSNAPAATERDRACLTTDGGSAQRRFGLYREASPHTGYSVNLATPAHHCTNEDQTMRAPFRAEKA